MTTNRFAASLLLVASMASSGCFTMNASLPGTLRSDIEESRLEKVGRFEKEMNHWFIPFGMGEAPSTMFREELLKEVHKSGADGVANLRFESYHGCFDLLVGAGTCMIVRPRTFKLSGDIVRIKKAPLPGKPPKAAPPPVKAPSEQITVEAERPDAEVDLVAY